MLAATKIDGLCLGGLKGLGYEFAALVAAIAKWLVLAFSARAPIIGFPGDDLNSIRRLLCNGGFHFCSSDFAVVYLKQVNKTATQRLMSNKRNPGDTRLLIAV